MSVTFHEQQRPHNFSNNQCGNKLAHGFGVKPI